MSERIGICDNYIYLQTNTSCPNSKYGDCCFGNQIFKLYE